MPTAPAFAFQAQLLALPDPVVYTHACRDSSHGTHCVIVEVGRKWERYLLARRKFVLALLQSVFSTAKLGLIDDTQKDNSDFRRKRLTSNNLRASRSFRASASSWKQNERRSKLETRQAEFLYLLGGQKWAEVGTSGQGTQPVLTFWCSRSLRSSSAYRGDRKESAKRLGRGGGIASVDWKATDRLTLSFGNCSIIAAISEWPRLLA